MGQFLQFRHLLKQWWLTASRDFPWRHHRSPYRTLIAELMLRRTRADQVVPVYERFVNSYPTLAMAAQADPCDIRAILYPLGLSWRIENIIDLLNQAYNRFGEVLPIDIEALLTLPGVGDYVAGAVACFAGGQPVALIDTNVVRVLGRVFGVDIQGEARRRREMHDLTDSALDRDDPVTYQYALLDFAAKVCTAKNPFCNCCPFSQASCCEFYKHFIIDKK